MKSKVEIIDIGNKLQIVFIYIPKGYKVSDYSLENHETITIGRLNQFNRIKIISSWKEEGVDLRVTFKNKLEKKGWDFKEYPNPVGFGVRYIK